MTPSGLHQTLGNWCVAVAALIYAVPLQYLLLELSRKRDDGGGVIAGLIILIPMWLLLLAALLGVTASGGFDWVRLNRPALYVLTVLAVAAMAVVSSFLRFEQVAHPSFLGRLVAVLPIHVFPVLTMLLVIFSLNPRFAMGHSLQIVNLPWTVLAALNLALCGGLVGYRLTLAGGRQVSGLTYSLRRDSELDRKNLTRLPALDPQRDFDDLLRLVDSGNRDVREGAIAQLRRNPDFATTLVAELTTGSVSDGSVNRAIAVVGIVAFTVEEQQLLALPARTAMERITKYTRSELRHFTKDRRTGTRRWGSEVFKAVAEKLKATGVDFQPAIDAFEQTFDHPVATDE